MPATRSRPSTEQAEVVSEEVKDVEASPVKEKVAETKTEEAKPAAEEKADGAEETKEEAEKTAEEAPKANGEAAAAVADDSNKESDSAPTEKAEKHKLEDEVSNTPEKKAKVEESKEEEAAKEAAPTEEAAAWGAQLGRAAATIHRTRKDGKEETRKDKLRTPSSQHHLLFSTICTRGPRSSPKTTTMLPPPYYPCFNLCWDWCTKASPCIVYSLPSASGFF